MNLAVRFTVSSGNVFADLGLPNPEERLAKAKLASRISEIVDGHGWTDEHAAGALGMDEAGFAALIDGRLAGFSIERLFRALIALGQAVEIRVSPAPTGTRTSGISVEIAEADETEAAVENTVSGLVPADVRS